MTHTPGPWRTYPNAEGLNLEIETANDFPPAEIARVHWMADGKNNEALKQESLANARLIAAAPELLEALKESTNAIDALVKYLGKVVNEDTSFVITLNKCKRAISKAEGK